MRSQASDGQGRYRDEKIPFGMFATMPRLIWKRRKRVREIASLVLSGDLNLTPEFFVSFTTPIGTSSRIESG